MISINSFIHGKIRSVCTVLRGRLSQTEQRYGTNKLADGSLHIAGFLFCSTAHNLLFMLLNASWVCSCMLNIQCCAGHWCCLFFGEGGGETPIRMNSAFGLHEGFPSLQTTVMIFFFFEFPKGWYTNNEIINYNSCMNFLVLCCRNTNFLFLMINEAWLASRISILNRVLM